MGISSGRVAIHFALWSDLCSIPMSKYQTRHRLWLFHGGGPHAYRMSNLRNGNGPSHLLCFKTLLWVG